MYTNNWLNRISPENTASNVEGNSEKLVFYAQIIMLVISSTPLHVTRKLDHIRFVLELDRMIHLSL